ncbi:hypothetical protein HD554DRAFT_2202082 [Boletus coccyginus]|nr:hypothetical protein HD554DRAFT_2202082 [Boletus coccyginus]
MFLPIERCLIEKFNVVNCNPGKYPALEQNSVAVKDLKQFMPKPIVIVIQLHEQPARLGLKQIELAKPLTIPLAVQGSKSKINHGIKNYNLILRTPFLFQHWVPSLLPLKGPQVQLLESQSSGLFEEQINIACHHLYELAKPLCTKASKTELPPLHAINHTIPIIDESKIYFWQPSQYLEALQPQ